MKKTFGKYEVVRELGRGAMGIVYLAFDPDLERQVAIKTISSSITEKDLRERFVREARSAGKLRHNNIVTIYDFDQEGDQLFIAMELLEGRDLDAVIEERPRMDIKDKLGIIRQICGGLEYAHQNGIYHRDIKPSNIKLLKDGNVKIMDFGLAGVQTSNLTKSGSVMGTPHYMAPERIRGEKGDGRSDQFAVGVILYELLTFQTCFSGDSILEIICKILISEPRGIDPKIKSRYPEIELIIKKATMKDPELRYGAMKEMAEEIERLQHKIISEGFCIISAVKITGEPIKTGLPDNEYSQLKEILRLLVGRPVVEGIVAKITPQYPELETIIKKTTIKKPGQMYWPMTEVTEAIELLQHKITNDEYSQLKEILHLPVERPVVAGIEPEGVFVGREGELSFLEKNQGIITIKGHGGVGKTTLAFELARRSGAVFKDGVLAPIRADNHTPMSFAMHLAGLLNEQVKEPPDAASARSLVSKMLKNRHCLLILDNASEWNDLKYMLPVYTSSTILVTTRNIDIYNHLRLQSSALQVHEVALEKFTSGEALDLFQQMLGRDYYEEDKKNYLEIAKTLGYLPIALHQAISLMVFEPRYRASTLRDKLSTEDRLVLLQKGLAVETIFDLASPQLTKELHEALEYLAVCSPGLVPLDFLKKLSGDEAIEERLERLHTYSWCERREMDNQRAYELHHLVRDLVQRRFGTRFQEGFIQAVNEIFMDENVHFRDKERLFPQLEKALDDAAKKGDKRLIDWLYNLNDFCTSRGYGDFYMRLTEHLEKLFPSDLMTLKAVYSHRASILQNWGKLNEAMTLYKKEEKINEQLGDRVGLAKCYGNQAVIFQIWGKLNEAMTLHKKEEKIKDELDDPIGLAKCYGNQALILYTRGELNEAMALRKKEEKIKEELDDRAGLAKCYGNQALILKEWGKFEEAMELHEKEEKIKEELGDFPGLACSYGNQALILKARGKLKEAMALHEKEEKIFEDWGYRYRLAECYVNKALILKAWGKFEEAMELHEKEEKIKKELGDRPGLAVTWWCQGIIYEKKNNYQEQEKLWRKSIQMDKSIGIPTGKHEEALEKLMNKLKK
jgi:serine/threonine protein kinase/tetratricopeptide (TPR) repeat protein